MKKIQPRTLTVEFTPSELQVIFSALCQAIHLHDPNNAIDQNDENRMRMERSVREWFGKLASEAGCVSDRNIRMSDITQLLTKKAWDRIKDCYPSKRK